MRIDQLKIQPNQMVLHSQQEKILVSSAIEDYLIDFHNRCPGATTKAFSNVSARSAQRQFESSYACLAELVQEASIAQSVLDIGCGDGYLLEIISRNVNVHCDLFGIDFSAREIDLAKTRLGDTATLEIGHAQALPFQRASMDCVLSHMAIMLMDDLPLVISECARVLKSGGIFSAVVGRRFLLGPIFDRFIPLLVDEMNQGQITHFKFGGGYLNQQNSVNALFRESFTELEVVDIDVPFHLLPEELWQELCATYSVDRLPDIGKTRLKESFLKSAEAFRNGDGLIETGWGLKRITAIRN